MELILKRRTELALRALRVLAAHGERMQGAELAARVDTSQNYLTQVMAPLIEARWVESGRGPTGGYVLAKPVAEISMLDLIVATEGTVPTGICVLEDGQCVEGRTCALHEPWQQLQAAVVAEFAALSILESDIDE